MLPYDKQFEELFVKVLGTGGFYDDSYTRVYVRRWKLGTNYIVPDALDYESDGLRFLLTSNALDGQVSDDRLGYLRLKKGSVSVKPVFGGAGTIFATYFTGSFATTVKLFAEEDELYTFTSEAGKIFFNERLAATGQVENMPGNMNLQCTWSNWICLCDLAALEYSSYSPSSGSGSLSGEDYMEGSNYDL